MWPTVSWLLSSLIPITASHHLFSWWILPVLGLVLLSEMMCELISFFYFSSWIFVSNCPFFSFTAWSLSFMHPSWIRSWHLILPQTSFKCQFHHILHMVALWPYSVGHATVTQLPTETFHIFLYHLLCYCLKLYLESFYALWDFCMCKLEAQEHQINLSEAFLHYGKHPN